MSAFNGISSWDLGSFHRPTAKHVTLESSREDQVAKLLVEAGMKQQKAWEVSRQIDGIYEDKK